MYRFWTYQLAEIDSNPRISQIIAAQQYKDVYRYKIMNIYDILSEPHLNEVIYRERPHKFFVDLDGKVSEYGQFGQQHVNMITTNIIYAFHKAYRLKLDPADIAFFTSSDDEKISYHVVVTRYYFLGLAVGKIFDILHSVCQVTQRYADKGVYGNIRFMRIFGMNKLNSERTKRYVPLESTILPDYDTAENEDFCILKASLITYTAETEFGAKEDPPQRDLSNLADVEHLQKYAHLVDQEVWSIQPGTNGTFLYLMRKQTSHCISCERDHERENAMLFMTGDRLYFRCFRSSSSILLMHGSTIEPEAEECGVATSVEIVIDTSRKTAQTLQQIGKNKPLRITQTPKFHKNRRA